MGKLFIREMIERMIIISNQEIASDIYELTLQGELACLIKEAGQFINILISDKLFLRRPFSICAVNKSQKQLTILYQVVGEGTKILASKNAGDKIDVFGPLGKGFPLIDNVQEVLLVGGGIGVAPLYELAKQLHMRNMKVSIVLGFASKAKVVYESELERCGEVYIATIDGSYGFRGNVIELIETKKINFKLIYSCGPKAMLKALQEKYQHIKGYVSIEERMACGIGACYGCSCKPKDMSLPNFRVCKDGPVFELNEVII